MAETERLGVVDWKYFQLRSTDCGLQFRYQFQSARAQTRITVDMDQLCVSEWTELLRYDGWVNW